VTEPGASAARFSVRTVWTQNLQTPLRRFLRTETGSAAVLLAATLAALAWANLDPSGYAAAWRTELVIRSGTIGLADSWQGWVNSGLMAFFFLVVGLEARREFDMGERRRLALPLVVALGGMVVPIAIYLAINAGRSSAPGWGAAMSLTAVEVGLFGWMAIMQLPAGSVLSRSMQAFPGLPDLTVAAASISGNRAGARLWLALARILAEAGPAGQADVR
jgi:Na+/H+ antiporter NhaA